MKKIILVLAAGFLLITTITAQDNTMSWNGKGTKVFSAGYGVGNIYKSLFKWSSIFADNKITSAGPAGIGIEYGISNKIGAGLQLSYGTVKAVATQKNGLGQGKDYVQTSKLTSFQALIRGNYHFNTSQKLDPYFGLGLGYASFKYSSKNNDPGTTPIATIIVPSALGFTGALGARYYLTTNAAVYGEIGYITGTIIQLGFSYKL